MKKLLSVILCFTFILSGCSGKKEPAGTIGSTLYEESFMKSEKTSAEEIANEILENSILDFNGIAMSVEEGYLNGFNEEIKGFKEAAVFSPMIGSIPFVGYVFILDESADVDAFIANLKDHADPRWNICTEAKETYVGKKDNKVFFVMAPESFEE